MGLLFPSTALADAFVWTRAMKATTIAEIFIEENEVILKLEVGASDVKGFVNLLPDNLATRFELNPRPWAERIDKFLKEDFQIFADGKLLNGSAIKLGPRNRVKRDEITGEAITSKKDELVVYGEFSYPFKGKPKNLSFRPPMKNGNVQATIGFVAYHQGIAVNDFRYLSTKETLVLNWSDPWYSRFENRNLKRQYMYPISAFIYVEPFEVRKEIIVRPIDLQKYWIDLGLEGKDIIKAEDQAELKKKVVEFFTDKNQVLIDGKPVAPMLDRIHFIRRTLRMTSVIDPPEDLSLPSATLGVIFVYPITALPQEVTMQWELFNDQIQTIQASSTDEAGGLPYNLSADDATLRWQNFLKNPTIPKLVDLVPPPQQLELFGIKNPFISKKYLKKEPSDVLLQGLLKNIYHAFDYRDESDSYDTLERSVEGDLLTEIYLETRRSLELKNQGGARVKVKEVTILDNEITPLKNEVGFQTRSKWNVVGSVGHWGHIHQRKNQYEAKLTVKSIGGHWKITDLEILKEERL